MKSARWGILALGVGAAGGLHFHVLGAERASSIFLLSAYTLGRQVIVDVPGDLYFPRGGSVSGRVRGVVFPDAYYGIGPSTQTSAREDFTRRAIEAWVGGEYPIVPNRLSAGPRLEVRSEEITDMQAGGALASGAVPGSRGFGVIGIGGTITYDSRDQPLSPERGSFAQMWILQYPAFVGGGHAAFTHGLLEGRKFLPLGRGRVLGVAAFVEQASADTPFTLLPKLGSTRYLRGWREGRFRDRLAWAAQAEIRLPLAGRLGAAVFGAVGDVARNLGALRADTLKVAAGAGLRFRLTREGASIRLDLAGSQAGPEVYAIMLEAF